MRLWHPPILVGIKAALITLAGKVINYWIDSKTYLLVQSSQLSNGMFGGRKNSNDNNATPKAPVEIITSYKDYSLVDGIQIPHTIETKGGMSGGGTTFDKIQLNIPVDAKLYKPE